MAILKKLPIPIATFVDQIPLIEKADLMLNSNSALYEISQKFQRTIQRKFALIELPKKLQEWYKLTFADFIKELNKAIKGEKGVPLTKKDEFEWMDLFEENKKKVLELNAEIDKTDREIDQLVYELYGLSEEEIKIVEGV